MDWYQSIAPRFGDPWAKEVFPLARFFCFSGGSGEEAVEEDPGVTIQFLPRQEDTGIIAILFSSPCHFNFVFSLLNAVVTGPGLQLQMLEAGIILKRETVTIFLKLYVRIPKGLMGVGAFTPSGKIGVNSE